MTRSAWAAALAIAIGLGGCTSQAPGEPSGTNKPTTTSPNPVPAITHPLDADPFIDRPCDLLPRKWTAQQGFEKGKLQKQQPGLAGPACSWDAPIGSDTAEGYVQVIILTQPRDAGVGGVRGLNSTRSQYGFFQLTNVDGYPAAYADGADQRAAGTTQLGLGVEDDLAIMIVADLFEREPQRSEPLAKAAAKQILKTLKAEQ